MIGTLALAAALLGACSNGGEPGTETETAPLPSGFTHVQAASAGVAFAAPEGWVDKTGEGLGAESDLFLIDPASPDLADPDNITVQREGVEAVEDLPSEQEVDALFESFGQRGNGYGERTAPIGDVVYGVSQSPAADPTSFMGLVFAYNDDDELVMIAITLTHEDHLEETTQTLAGTLSSA